MLLDTEDTIAAIATAAGAAARGMVRISGPRAVEVVEACFRADDGESLAQCRRAAAIPGTLHLVLDSRILTLDAALFLWPTARSYTRQPLAELHTLGSRPALDAVLSSTCQAGARLAAPGEFTLRAFLAGRLDLTQAEAVLGVIDAQGTNELDTALSQLAGGLAMPLHQLRDDLLQLLAELEAGLDFADEDIEFIARGEAISRLSAGRALLDDVSAQMSGRMAASGREQVVFIGPPNVGKSSLFNALVANCRAAARFNHQHTVPALVSPVRGTTRDYLTAELWLDGVGIELMDTAGIEECPVERIDAAAQTVGEQRQRGAAVRLVCADACDLPARCSQPLDAARDIVVLTKADLSPTTCRSPALLPAGLPFVATSSRTGVGIDELCRLIRVRLAGSERGGHSAVVATTAERCRESVRLAAESIEQAIAIASANGGEELVAAELRVALHELGQVVGAVYTDDLLDRVFSTFCIGK